MSKKGRWGEIKRGAELRSIAKNRQTHAQKLQKKLKKLTEQTVWTQAMQDKLNEHRMEYSKKARELAETAMEGEIAIYEDIKLQLQR